MGNPSDGYGGKALAVEIPEFAAEVTFEPWDTVEIVPAPEDDPPLRDLDALAEHVTRHGYYGGRRLLLATARAFRNHAVDRGTPLAKSGFRVAYKSTIPRQVGLGGSSAIVVATLRGLCAFFHVEIPPPVMSSLALAVERDELGIPAGLMDRVVQVYGGLVAMDLTRDAMHDVDGLRCGRYEVLDAGLLPRLYLSYGSGMAEPTEAVHGTLRRRFLEGDSQVLRAMARLADGVDRALEALRQGDESELGRLMDANFELRRSISPVAPEHLAMVAAARSVGAPAKFAGSGGAIVGIVPPSGLERLREILEPLGCSVLELSREREPPDATKAPGGRESAQAGP